MILSAVLISLFGCENIKVTKGDSSITTDAPSLTIETFASSTTPTQSEEEDTTSPYYVTLPQSSTATTSTTVPTTVSEADTAVCEPVTTPSSEEYTISDYDGVMYANASVNVREKPDADSSRIGHLDEGDKVTVTGLVSNGWCRIIFKGKEYYVNGRYLTDHYEPEETRSPETEATEPTATTTEKTEITTSATTPDTTEESIIIEEIDIDTGIRSYQAINYSTQKAFWIAYLDIDTMLAGADEASFTEAVRKAMINIRFMGCNTVYVHARAFGDAYYFSDIYPFAASYSGTVGVRPGYDPLEIMIREAHNLGLSFHAWINPMRTTNKTRFGQMSDSYAIKKWYSSSSTNGKYIVYDSDSGYYWLSPAYTAVRELICSGIAEIVSKYDVDGIHIDDYFYPTTSTSFDKDAFKASGYSDLSAWRREIVSQLVRDIYSAVKFSNSTVEFGISPAGNISNNLNRYYADVARWCSEDGFLDYIVPQIYYGYTDKLPFDQTALDWQSIVTNPRVKLVCGIAAYKVGSNTEWRSGDILARQTNYVNSLPGYSGCAYFRYGSVFEYESGELALDINEYSKLAEALAALS